MANEIANISHAGLVVTVFQEEDQRAPQINLSWGLDLATLRRVSEGFWSVRLTQPLGLTLDATDPRAARFGFLVTAQSIALPNFVTGFITPDPFAPSPVVPVPGVSIPFGWLTIKITDRDNEPVDVTVNLNVEVRRISPARS